MRSISVAEKSRGSVETTASTPLTCPSDRSGTNAALRARVAWTRLGFKFGED